jgi:hypothetical protein
MVAVRRLGSFVASGMLVALVGCGTASAPEPSPDAGPADAAVVDAGVKRDAGSNGDGGYVSEVDAPPASAPRSVGR